MSDVSAMPSPAAPREPVGDEAPSTRLIREYGFAVATPLVCTALAWVLSPYFLRPNLLVVHLAGIVVLAVRVGRGPALAGATLTVLAFDSLFLRPALEISARDTQYFVTLAVMVALAAFISDQSQRIRQQARAAGQRERSTAALDALSRALADASGIDAVLATGARHLSALFDSAVVAWLPDGAGRLVERVAFPAEAASAAGDLEIARWVWEHREPAGPGALNVPGASGSHFPLIASGHPVGVLLLRPLRTPPGDVSALRTLAEPCAARIAGAVEHQSLLEEAQQARMRLETERVRNTLLSAVSHDLRTPMAAIKGSATSLIEGHRTLDDATRLELAEAIRDESDRLTRLIGNLLDMTRLQSGSTVRRQWHALEELVGAALASLEPRLDGREVSIALPADLPLIMADGVLIQQVLSNLLENAVKYTPPGTPIEISAAATDSAVTVTVADHGPGLGASELTRVFEKFYRGSRPTADGLGLGLAICRSIVDAHGGRMWVENRAGGGAAFRFRLPAAAPPAGQELSEPAP